ncbi:hypothetical protein Cgig2_002101 [Carnegiea gigantea]|uniref:CCHC-type domain-containing protein n=1 Tax=Carnegiea gigantea TaxID=171969 RepID=A0A9Q1KT27_9CARY|nr:hypothetical protein Cgig2_002101 [Carnegiea gigantea]
MKSIFRNMWKRSKRLVIRELDSNLFAFQFFAAANKDYVLNEGPWAFDGSLLLLKRMTGLEVSSEVVFSTARFWVKAYDVPGKKQTVSFAQILASHIGEFVGCYDATMFGIDKALCFRVDIDISNPLRRGIYIKVADRQIWIRFKYVRLPDFCYGCGKLGHVLAGCDTVQIEDDDPNLQCVSWLRASPLKSRRHSVEMELHEEKRLYSAFSKQAASFKARTKLTFAIGATTPHIPHSTAADNSTNMIIDAATFIDPGGDFNEIFFHSEKSGGPQTAIDNFRMSFTDNGLYDLGYTGYDFTWCNYQTNGVVAEERLDCFCADAEWSLMFPDAMVTHIDSDMSDHLPIILKCFPRMDRKGTRKRRFQFENMWITESSCNDVVQIAWTSVSNPNAVDKLLDCIDKCSAKLLEWNATTFGDGHTLNIWDDRWLPRPTSFRPITPKTDAWADLKVSDLIDHTTACWRESLIHQIFLDCDSELIPQIPLCNSWPPDKLTWHYHPQGFFYVRSTYHMLIADSQASTGSSSLRDHSFWRAIWNCSIPPHIKLFAWRAATGILPSALAISRRIPNFSMSYRICGHVEESDIHALLECPIASQIWQDSDFD